jgi:hypothetical protein
LNWKWTQSAGAHYFDGDTRADKLLPKRLNRLEYFLGNFDTALDTFKRFLLG